MVKPTVFILVGVPGSGKSTWIANQMFDWNRTVVASTDGYIERQAKEQGKTYSDVFQAHMKDANRHMLFTVSDAIAKDLDIIWDQTSTSVATRAKKLNMIPDDYRKVAVFFPTPEEKEHQRRLDSRPGKTIPDFVLRNMKKDLTIPTREEGFDEIVIAK